MAQRDYDDLKAMDDADHAELERARQALAHPRVFRKRHASDTIPLRSPISGVVLDVGTAAGELQRSLDNATAIATIADINPIWVMGDLYPRDVGSIKVGEPVDVSVTGYPGEVFHGTINNISDAVDPASLTLKVRVVLPNPQHRLKPQMYATIAVTNHKGTAIVVPSTAVIQNGKQAFVFVETSPGKYARRTVTLGATHDKTDEILQGLERRRQGCVQRSRASARIRGSIMQTLIRVLLRFRNVVLIIFLASLAVGAVAFLQLDIEAYPDPSPPMVEFITQNPSWSAEEMEQQVTVPLEAGLNGTPKLEQIRSISIFGLSDVKMYFSFDSDYFIDRQEALNRLQQVNLPNNLQPQLSPESPIGEIYRYQLTGPGYSLNELKATQDWFVVREMKQVPGHHRRCDLRRHHAPVPGRGRSS